MVFDLIIQNPPYQANTRNMATRKGQKGAGHTLWHQFCFNSIKRVRSGGILASIHPPAWRRGRGIYLPLKEHLLAHHLLKLNMHSVQDGCKAFQAYTAYDVVIIRKTPDPGTPTDITDIDGVRHQLRVQDYPILPNGAYEETLPLFAGDKVKFKRDYSSNIQFTHRNERVRSDVGNGTISPVRTEEFRYPLVWMLNKGCYKFFWTNTTKNGCFGVPKVIMSNGRAGQPLLDLEGRFGLSQFAFVIMDTPERMKLIYQALRSAKWRRLSRYLTDTAHYYDYHYIQFLNRDFFKEFIYDTEDKGTHQEERRSIHTADACP